jgi:hypothetical protein
MIQNDKHPAHPLTASLKLSLLGSLNHTSHNVVFSTVLIDYLKVPVTNSPHISLKKAKRSKKNLKLYLMATESCLFSK